MPERKRERPRNFIPLDIDYWRQDTIADLLDRFGCDGPSVLLVIIAEAHRQAHAGPKARQGEVDIRYAALARELRLGATRVQEVVLACADLGLLDIAADEAGRAGRLRARLLKWGRWEVRDVCATERKRRQRDKSREENRAE